MILSANARDLFSAPNLGWATTLRPDGTPHNTVVWVDVDGNDIVFNTAIGRVKEQHLRSDPRISVSVLDPQNGQRFASITGAARLSIEDGDEVIDKLARKYLGVDSYPYRTAAEQRVSVRVTPEKLVEQAG